MSKWDQIQNDPEFQSLSPEEKVQFAQMFTMNTGQTVAGISSLGVKPEAPVADTGLGAQFGAGIDETQGALWQTTADVMGGFGFAGATAYAQKQAKNNFERASKVGYQTESLTDALSEGDIGDFMYGGLERLVRSSPAIAGTVGASFIPGAGVGVAASMGLAGAQQYGSIRQEQIERGNEDKAAAAMGAVGGAVLERVGLGRLGLLKGTGSQVAARSLAQVPKKVAGSVVSEGATEAGQEAIAAVAAGERDLGTIAGRSLEASLAGGLSGGYLTTGKAAFDQKHNITAGMGEAGKAVTEKFNNLTGNTNLLVSGDTEGLASVYADELKSQSELAKGFERNSPEYMEAIDNIYANIDGLKYTAEADVLTELRDAEVGINNMILDEDMKSRYEFNEGLGYRAAEKIQQTFAVDQQLEDMNKQSIALGNSYDKVRSGTNQILSNLQRNMRSTEFELNQARKIKRNAISNDEAASAQARINELTAVRKGFAEDLSLVRGIYEGIKSGSPDASKEKMELALNFDLAAGTNLATQLQKAAVINGMNKTLTENRRLREGSKVESSVLRTGLALGTGGVSVVAQNMVGRLASGAKRRAERKAVEGKDLSIEGVDTELQSDLAPELNMEAQLQGVEEAVKEADVARAIRTAPTEKDDSTAYAKAAEKQGTTESQTGNVVLDDLIGTMSKKGTSISDAVSIKGEIEARRKAQEAEQKALDEALTGRGKADPLDVMRGAMATKEAKAQAKKERDAAKKARKEEAAKAAAEKKAAKPKTTTAVRKPKVKEEPKVEVKEEVKAEPKPKSKPVKPVSQKPAKPVESVKEEVKPKPKTTPKPNKPEIKESAAEVKAKQNRQEIKKVKRVGEKMIKDYLKGNTAKNAAKLLDKRFDDSTSGVKESYSALDKIKSTVAKQIVVDYEANFENNAEKKDFMNRFEKASDMETTKALLEEFGIQ